MYLLILLPIVSALIGWLLATWIVRHFVFTVIPNQQRAFAAQIGKLAAEQLVSFKALEEKIAGPESIGKIMPVIEGHIDHFLRHKLSKAMPVISMFIGDKTINQLKEVFMKELNVIFPETMKSYVQNLETDLDIEQLVSDKIGSFPVGQIQDMLLTKLSRPINKFKIATALFAALISILNVLALYFYLRN
ncbi:MAG: DUF445 domain-containing protein [Chitinophagaceae bacterium]|nr:DUF445 domain-containing protein [Chitinophagaceae bacterium]